MMASASISKRSKPKQQFESMKQKRDWLELPSDLLVDILCRIGAVDVLLSVQRVCTTWYKICKKPALWRVIHMDFSYYGPYSNQVLCHLMHVELCKQAVDRSQGQLVDITLVGIADDELLWYIADRSSQLKRLDIACSFVDKNESWTEAFAKFPSLEELSLYAITISKEAIETAGRCCPMLKTLKLSQEVIKSEHENEMNIEFRNMKAMVIAENFPELTHLELIGSKMTDSALKAILDGCLHLESLDLRQCLHIDLKGDVMKRCSKHIKYLRLPNDSLEDHPYNDIKVKVIPVPFRAPFVDEDEVFHIEDFID